MTMDFVGFDVETANSNRGSICAIGLVLVRNGRLERTEYWLAQPPAGIDHFDAVNVSIHGIQPEDVLQAPPLEDRLSDLLELSAGLPLVAHNAAFDIGAIRDALDALNEPWPSLSYACTRVLSRRSLDLVSYSLPMVCRELSIAQGPHHVASADAEAAARIALALAGRMKASSVSELADLLQVRLGQVDPESWIGCRSVGQPQKNRPTLAATPPPANTSADPDHDLFGQVIVFTGGMSLARKEAWHLSAALGATPEDRVTARTSILVIGDGFQGTDPAEFSSGKALRAADLKRRGQDIEILTESEFLLLIGESRSSGARPSPLDQKTSGARQLVTDDPEDSLGRRTSQPIAETQSHGPKDHESESDLSFDFFGSPGGISIREFRARMERMKQEIHAAWARLEPHHRDAHLVYDSLNYQSSADDYVSAALDLARLGCPEAGEKLAEAVTRIEGRPASMFCRAQRVLEELVQYGINQREPIQACIEVMRREAPRLKDGPERMFALWKSIGDQLGTLKLNDCPSTQDDHEPSDLASACALATIDVYRGPGTGNSRERVWENWRNFADAWEGREPRAWQLLIEYFASVFESRDLSTAMRLWMDMDERALLTDVSADRFSLALERSGDLKNSVRISNIGASVSENDRLRARLEARAARCKKRLEAQEKPAAHSKQAPGLVPSAVRAWAKENGYTVSQRGRIHSEVFEAYLRSQTPFSS